MPACPLSPYPTLRWLCPGSASDVPFVRPARRPENLDTWLNPDPKHLQAQCDILDNPVDAYYGHELVNRDVEDRG